MLPASGPGAGSALLRLVAAGALIAAGGLVLPYVARHPGTPDDPGDPKKPKAPKKPKCPWILGDPYGLKRERLTASIMEGSQTRKRS